jgi:arsenate reductase
MISIEIWHNDNCSKSRKALEILKNKDVNIKIIKYLETNLNKNTIKNILKMLDIKPKELMRKDESIYFELNLEDENDENNLIKAMIENPILIQRPIIIKDNKAVIARPMDNIDKLF